MAIVEKQKSFEEEIIELYTHSGFGKVLKSEIDSVVFHHVLIRELAAIDEKLLSGDGEPLYTSIDKRHISALSLKLRITESQVCRFLENDYLLYNKTSYSISAILLEIIKDATITAENIKDKKLRFYIANPILQKLIQVEIYKVGGIVDCSFNKDVISVDLFDCLKLLNFNEAAIKQIILDCIDESEIKALPAVNLLITQLQEKTIPEQIKSVVKGIAGRFLGDTGGEDAVDLVCRIFKMAIGR
ncbi:hypothetical protein FACS1894137_17170 [Spirochaetia bacterium]|nr:hypothetical protein FACS1894137_17170 [Spirochaetia bacterium]